MRSSNSDQTMDCKPDQTDLITENLSRIEIKLTNMEERILKIENDIDQLKRSGSSNDEKKPVAISGKPRPVGHQLADHVTSLVGLREVVKSKHHVTKGIWAILFFGGISATIFFMYKTADEYLDNPTATRVYLLHQAIHKFPPLLLCPKPWFDAEKAFSLGLSLDGLKYSLSYFDLATFPLSNASQAKDEFLSIYELHNLKSLLDYYKAISPDLELKNINSNTSTKSTFICRGCNETRKPDKTILEHRLCHVFYLKGIEPGFGMYAGFRWINIRHRANTLGLIAEIDWDVYFSPNTNAFISMYPKVSVKPFTHNTVKFSQQKFINMNSKEAPCNKKEENYTAITCMAQCHNKMFHEALNCRVIWLSFLSSKNQPTEICNFLDRYTPQNLSLHEFFESEQNKLIDAKAASECVEKCPRDCNRMSFDATLQFETKFLPTNINGAIESNATSITINIQHEAVYQGGIRVLHEVSTYSFTDLVNNIGGTLGLFVGATVMTFAQLISFLIDYIYGKKQRRKICWMIDCIGTCFIV